MSALDLVQRRLQAKWLVCQWGVRECLDTEASRDYALAWLHRQGDPLSHEWAELLLGHRPELQRALLTTTTFPGTGRWRQLVTSSPFPLLKRHLAEQHTA